MKSLETYITESMSDSEKKGMMKAIIIQVENLWENGFKDKSDARKHFQAYADGKDDGSFIEQLYHMMDMDGEYSYDECYDESEFLEEIIKEQVKIFLSEK